MIKNKTLIVIIVVLVSSLIGFQYLTKPTKDVILPSKFFSSKS